MENDVASTSNYDHTVVTSKLRDCLTKDTEFASIVLRPKMSLPYHKDPGYVRQHQDIINRNALCLTRIREAAREVESLRLENVALRSFNLELNNHLKFLMQASSIQKQQYPLPYYIHSNAARPFQILNYGFDDFCNIGGVDGEKEEETCEDESPTSVMQVKNIDTTSPERISVPKSISVRSNGYLKTNQASTSKTRSVPGAKRLSQPVVAQKVYVPGRKEWPVELEVYNQGMFKTELCNKWQETGTCPYENNCQFSHGTEELRPVIRHPRYKTEDCRMVLAGDVCPYGHRCHFRHVLTDQKRFTGQL